MINHLSSLGYTVMIGHDWTINLLRDGWQWPFDSLEDAFYWASAKGAK